MTSMPGPEWTVYKTLHLYPYSTRVFIQLRTDCVGCLLARFCTLAEVEHDFDLDTGMLVNEIRLIIKNSPEGSKP